MKKLQNYIRDHFVKRKMAVAQSPVRVAEESPKLKLKISEDRCETKSTINENDAN